MADHQVLCPGVSSIRLLEYPLLPMPLQALLLPSFVNESLIALNPVMVVAETGFEV